jgi:pimeloyl-ACP methyl ester carboxylesterase
MKIRANNIDIEVEDSAAGLDSKTSQRPVVLLIMGLGMQLIAWPPAFVQGLVDAGYRVVRFDNRDIGLSQNFNNLGKPNLIWATLKYKLGLPVNPPYSLIDMAADALGVLDALGIQRAHIVGVSMGGMIAQRLALAAPQRCLSLTSIMSSSGARGLPQARPEVTRVLLGRPKSAAANDVVDHVVRLYKAISSPAHPTPEPELRERILAAFQRSYRPVGAMRQIMAIVADTSRAEALAGMTVPTLVIHGKADALVPFACGQDTARRIPGAELVALDGMGHDLPAGLIPRLLAPLIPHLKTNA